MQHRSDVDFPQRLGKQGISPQELALVCSEDTHYSAHKAANLLGIDLLQVPVDENSRQMEKSVLAGQITESKTAGQAGICLHPKHGHHDVPDRSMTSIPFVRCSTVWESNFGFTSMLRSGFCLSVFHPIHRLDFRNPRVLSMTMDAHKMLQAPYGTRIFLCRKEC